MTNNESNPPDEPLELSVWGRFTAVGALAKVLDYLFDGDNESINDVLSYIDEVERRREP